MAGQFTSPDGDLKTMFVDDYAMIDQFAMTGSLWVWGNNSNGQLGDNTTVNKSSPVQTVAGGTNWKQISTGVGCTSAIKTDGTLWTWGSNSLGQLGDNTTVPKSSPVQTAAGGTNWKQVSSGYHCTSAVKTDGTLWLWGYNYMGCLGTNDTVDRSSPVQTVVGGTNWKQVSCGKSFTGAIKTDGTLWMWGTQVIDGTNHGMLGDGTNTPKSSPVQIAGGGTNWKNLSCGYNQAGAIKTDGTLWMWGRGPFGGVGDGTNTNRSSPVQIAGGGTNWKRVSCKNNGAYAIKTDGTLWMWGYSSYVSSTIFSTPVQYFSGTNWKSVECNGDEAISAIKTDGTLWLWGRNLYGQLGDGTTINRSSPVQTVSGGTNWKQCSSNSYGASAAIHFYDAGNLYPSPN